MPLLVDVLLVLIGTTSAARSSSSGTSSGSSSKPNFVIFLQDDQDFLNGHDGLRPM
jgi:hypothetical protein